MKVLFVCRVNVGRSQMAEAFCNTYAPLIETMSAGTGVPAEYEKKPISAYTERVIRSMRELGIDMSGRTILALTPAMVGWADKIIALNAMEELPEFLKKSPKLEVWNVPDAGNTDEVFHATIRDVIRAKIQDFIKRTTPTT